ncbi:MAG: M3 family metallopeptidase [Bacteroidota bacterium]|nr:M3 family metallopeptidase [Bacteroidota bacterium]MDP4211884.1 M3 family metallopeptidase [Bacteroidota bacterium]MDP4248527.1 M3 family metallopeptidase [Bacteroidota bacterium]
MEPPSQFLENFCWEYPSLKIFSRHYKTGAVPPESLFQKMETASKKGYKPCGGRPTSNAAISFAEGTHMIASFGHPSTNLFLPDSILNAPQNMFQIKGI